jgi:hypothetical protein
MKRSIWLVCILALGGCAAKSSGPGEHWVIVGHRAPGVSTMSDADAAKWHGRSIDFGPDWACAGSDTCHRPMYHTGPAPLDSVLASYQVAPGSLDPTVPPGATVTLTQVLCDGETWYSPGAVVLRTSPTHAYTPWEGVFFELKPR